MKPRQTLSILLSAVVLGTSIPSTVGLADEASGVTLGSAHVSATRGRVEVLSAGGKWEPLQGPVALALGSAVRTAPGAEAVATFADGSTVKLSERSAMRVADVARDSNGPRVALKVLGEVVAQVSPDAVSSGTTTLEFPMGRATISKQVALGRAVRGDVASGQAEVAIQTVTGGDVRVGVVTGAVAFQNSFNVEGRVVSVDAASSSFTLFDESAQQNRRILVHPGTQLAMAGDSAAPSGPSDLLNRVAGQQWVSVYGAPVVAEGPGDAEPSGVNATVIYPKDGSNVNPDAFLRAPLLPAESGTELQKEEALEYRPSRVGFTHWRIGFGGHRHQNDAPSQRDYPPSSWYQ